MRLTLTEEQRALRESARRVLADTYTFTDRRRIAAGGGFDPEVWARFADLGWLALPLPEEHGGLGCGPVEVAVLAEELGRAAVLERWIACVVLAGGVIAALGTREQVAALLPPMAEGTSRPALAHIERGDALMQVASTAHPVAGGWEVTGHKALVLDGHAADILLVTAQTEKGLGVFILHPGAEGLTLSPVDTIDGGKAADLVLDRVQAERLGAGDATEAVLACLDRANAAQCADAVGAMAALLDATTAYTKERVQFGQPLAKFQALRHRMAEMAVKVEEARGAALLAALSAEVDAETRMRGVSGARAKIGRLSRHVAQEAIQLHGAMGFSEEMPVGTWFKRLYTFENLWGSTALHLKRYAGVITRREVLEGSLLRPGEASDETLNLTMSADDAAFRDDVRDFLKKHLPEETKRAERLNPSFLADPRIGLPWQAMLAQKGWAAPSWPTEHGGPGWTLTQRYIFDQESERAGEPHFRGASLKMIAPVLMRFGTEAQKAFYLPRILSGQDLWAQGYSEPGSGSDLASLSMRAVRDGDHYVLNGSKIWSTLGHHATRMFALVRTDDTGRKQQGITFLLIDMKAPGITLKPIISICGTHEFNQVFFDDVRVPVADRVGEEGQGWTIAKYLLEFERGGSFAGGLLRALYARLHRMADAPGPDGTRALDDPLFVARFAEIGTDIDANDMLELTALSAVQSGGNPGSVPSSVMKIERSRIRQAITELGAQILGPEALRWYPERPLHDLPPQDAVAEDRLVAPAVYLNARSQSIFGGSNEIQLEIIARELLG
ncbi:acyl-CoA dehydrogenase [Pararhodobacter marinus]|uniref:acyl-CoA dehydrogenase n=1 Tax=Pararhodobacter marinus TaxID=2184063 RepID=UPI0035115370